MAYLNEAGLQRLWAKIKNLLTLNESPYVASGTFSGRIFTCGHVSANRGNVRFLIPINKLIPTSMLNKTITSGCTFSLKFRQFKTGTTGGYSYNTSSSTTSPDVYTVYIKEEGLDVLCEWNNPPSEGSGNTNATNNAAITIDCTYSVRLP